MGRVVSLCLLLLTSALGAQEAPVEYARQDPGLYRGAEACGECHVSEHQVWMETPHATGFKTLHRKESAETIAQKLGFRLIKRDSLCIKCHYTPVEERGQLRALSGVSCESCHGAARDWIEVHNDYGGRGFDHESETPEHRASRIEASRQGGMRRPSDLYPVAAACYECHLVLDERLVNVGGHSTGSGNFELVNWSQGEIRHNFLAALRGGASENQERAIEVKRRMYVAGRALDLEYSLRGVAAATEAGTYVKAMARRNRIALGEVREIASRTELPEVRAMIDVVRGVKVVLGQGPALEAAADQIAEVTRGFLTRTERRDVPGLERLDPLILGIEEPAGDIRQEISGGGETTRPGSGDDRQPQSGVSSAPSSASAPAGDAGIPADRVVPAPRAALPGADRTSQPVARIRTRLRPRSDNKTLGGACSGCHAPQNEWWFDDPHFASADPFFDQERKNIQIARLYGINPQDMTKGNQVCMDCHGTIVSGKERREVQDGVGCEGCHGAGEKFLEPHKEGEKSLGENRPGYQDALALGMVKLRDLGIRAERCTLCHYITEPRLISAGHPSGAGFDYVAGMSKIRHWEHPVAARGSLEAAFGGVLSGRGPVPAVTRAVPGSDPSGADSPSSASDPAGRTSAGARGGDTAIGSAAPRAESNPIVVAPPIVRPVSSRSIPEPRRGEPVALPPFPPIDESTSIEELLLLIKERLELLHRTVHQEP